MLYLPSTRTTSPLNPPGIIHDLLKSYDDIAPLLRVLVSLRYFHLVFSPLGIPGCCKLNDVPKASPSHSICVEG